MWGQRRCRQIETCKICRTTFAKEISERTSFIAF